MNFIFYSITNLNNVIVDFIMYKSDIQNRHILRSGSRSFVPESQNFLDPGKAKPYRY